MTELSPATLETVYQTLQAVMLKFDSVEANMRHMNEIIDRIELAAAEVPRISAERPPRSPAPRSRDDLQDFAEMKFDTLEELARHFMDVMARRDREFIKWGAPARRYD